MTPTCSYCSSPIILDWHVARSNDMEYHNLCYIKHFFNTIFFSKTPKLTDYTDLRLSKDEIELFLKQESQKDYDFEKVNLDISSAGKRKIKKYINKLIDDYIFKLLKGHFEYSRSCSMSMRGCIVKSNSQKFAPSFYDIKTMIKKIIFHKRDLFIKINPYGTAYAGDRTHY